MKGSLYIGKVSGIKIFIHWTFLILVVWIVMLHLSQGHGLRESLFGLAFIGAVFVCITLHELGHALTAKRFNIKTSSINLLPIGGVAMLEGMPEKPKQELLVAIMGPAVNVAIAALLYIVLTSTKAFPTDIETATKQLEMSSEHFWFNLFAVNLFLVLFNLIPAFPMDGGRVLRALLSFRMSRVKATKAAARLGQVFAFLFVLAGFAGNPMLVFIGLFIYVGASAEALYETTRFELKDVKIGDVLMHDFTVMKSNEPLSTAVKQLLDGQQQSFVVMDNGEPKGILSRKEIIAGLSEHGNSIAINKVMRTDSIPLQADELLNDALMKMKDGDQSFTPVYRGNKFIGVLDKENVTEFLLVKNASAHNA